MGLNYCSNDKTTEAMYDALVNSSPPLPPQDGMPWHPVTPGKWDSRAVMREAGEEAIRLCCGPRNADYGPPEENHANTALLWNAYLNMIGHRALSGADVCWMMLQVKKAREEHHHKRDNIVDMIGYLLNMYACQKS